MSTLTIVETGHVPEALRPVHGSYPEMFASALGAERDGLAVRVVSVEDATYPAVETLDAVLITGSPAGVYEDHAWIPPLTAFVRRVHAAGIPMVGVCFGHQLIAQALGGVVRKSEKGWGMGRHVYSVAPGNGIIEAGELAVACSHQDQVVEPPPSAEVFLSSAFTPYAGLRYTDGTTVTVQAHPEFTPDYALALGRARAGQAPDEVVSAATVSLRSPLDSRLLNEAIVRFLFDQSGRSSKI